jgi:hypothetical protein
MAEDLALDGQLRVRRPAWQIQRPLGRAARWLRGIALVNAKREREWYEPDKYATEMPFLKDDWPRGSW